MGWYNVVKPLPNAIGTTLSITTPTGNVNVAFGIWGGPAYFRTPNSQYVYYAGHEDNRKRSRTQPLKMRLRRKLAGFLENNSIQ
jgi:hypothetical protein